MNGASPTGWRTRPSRWGNCYSNRVPQTVQRCSRCSAEFEMTKIFRTLDDVDVKGKRILLRVDLNVPTENGRVTDTTRLERVAPTITEMSGKGGKVILLAHFGRPRGRDAKESLKPVADALAAVIGKPVAFADDCVGELAGKAVAAMKDG